jgi:glucose-1-phosphatase
MIKGIIFDLGNVLLDFDHRIAASRIQKCSDKSEKEIYELFFDSGITELFEEGKITPLDFFHMVKESLGLRMEFDEFVPVWNEIFFFTEKNRAVYDTAASLKGRYNVLLLSNINILHFEYIKKTFRVLDAFHTVITSFQANSRKPKSQIYRQAIEVLGFPAQEIFYTDDRPELIESARQLGISGFVFSGIEKLKRDLFANGIHIN